jgi:type I restriction enzyme, R subunit
MTAERELAIQQIVSNAVVSTEIVDIMKAAGLESPDISVLSDEFLAEVRESKEKNFAIEALKKLINGSVRSQSKRNVTQSKAFSERLEAAIARYHANALTTAEVLERTDSTCQGHSRGARSRRRTGAESRRNCLLRCAGRERERAAGDGRTGPAGYRA